MGTEKGRSARIRAEKEERENARVISASGFYTDAVSIREVKEYQRIKYAGLNERVSGKSYEGRLPATYLLPAEHIKERIGTTYPQMDNGGFIPSRLHPTCCQKVRKAHLNMPDATPEPAAKKQNATPEYDPTQKMPRDGRKRPNLGDSQTKARNTSDPSVMRRAWRMMDEQTRAFVKLKSK